MSLAVAAALLPWRHLRWHYWCLRRVRRCRWGLQQHHWCLRQRVGASCSVGAFRGAVGANCGAVGAFGSAIGNFGAFGSAFAGAVGAFGIAVGNEEKRIDQIGLEALN